MKVKMKHRDRVDVAEDESLHVSLTLNWTETTSLLGFLLKVTDVYGDGSSKQQLVILLKVPS